MKKSLYVCNGCGKEHTSYSELIAIMTSQKSDTLIVWKKDQRHEVLRNDEMFHFCDVDCLKRFFEDL